MAATSYHIYNFLENEINTILLISTHQVSCEYSWSDKTHFMMKGWKQSTEQISNFQSTLINCAMILINIVRIIQYIVFSFLYNVFYQTPCQGQRFHNKHCCYTFVVIQILYCQLTGVFRNVTLGYQMVMQLYIGMVEKHRCFGS